MEALAPDQEVMFDGTWETFGNWLDERSYTKVFVLVDENTERDCYSRLPEYIHDKVAAHIVVPPGEQSKSLEQCERIWRFFIQNGVDRDCLLINIGGGVVCDLGGFCAATILRGIDIVHMPTSLLAMVDAAIGGKTGINFEGGKNLIGQFVHPRLLCIQTDFLNTLDERNIRAGMAEMAKHAMLESEDRWRNFYIAVREEQWTFGEWIPLSVRFKFEIVEEDFREQRLRQILNLGHTIAHAIESIDAFDDRTAWLHGEAVWAGLWCTAFLSEKKYGGLELIEQLTTLCNEFIPGKEIHLDALDKVKWDKKRKGERVRMVLLERVGNPKWPVPVSSEEIRDAARHYNEQVAR